MNIYEIPIHEAADCFPMIPDAELAELAEDIKTNGLHHPIVYGMDENNEPILIDGRNRRAACKLAEIPESEVNSVLYKGSDIPGFILSENINRRHMTKSQQAISVAKMYPETQKGGRGHKSVLNTEFSPEYLSKARLVLREAPDMAEAVLKGALSLTQAYMEIKQRNNPVDSFNALQERSPELANLVREGDMTLDAAVGESVGDTEVIQEAVRRLARQADVLGGYSREAVREALMDVTIDIDDALLLSVLDQIIIEEES